MRGGAGDRGDPRAGVVRRDGAEAEAAEAGGKRRAEPLDVGWVVFVLMI